MRDLGLDRLYYAKFFGASPPGKIFIDEASTVACKTLNHWKWRRLGYLRHKTLISHLQLGSAARDSHQRASCLLIVSSAIERSHDNLLCNHHPPHPHLLLASLPECEPGSLSFSPRAPSATRVLALLGLKLGIAPQQRASSVLLACFSAYSSAARDTMV